MEGRESATITRREMCAGMAGVGLGWLLSSCASGNGSPPARGGPATTLARFDHGVASFDPSPDGVLLWTRVSGVDDSVSVTYRVGRDASLDDVVSQGEVETGRDEDFTATAIVDGLDPGEVYFYRFAAPGASSPVGRTRTLAADPNAVRLGVVSCSNYAYGHFAAYAELGRRDDLDAVVHLGDYVYEFGPGTYDDPTVGRPHDPPHEAVTLDDYRRRYGQYRRDPDLQELHRRHPMLALWDDHEFADNAWLGGAGNHQAGEGSWELRRASAAQAFHEWVPVRTEAERDGSIYRAVRFGGLCDLVLLDTRHAGRDAQPSALRAATDPGRHLLGAQQEEFAAEVMQRSASDGVAWRIVGQQVMVAPLTLGGRPINVDQWDAYPLARDRFLELLTATGDAVVLTGDIHSSWANDLPRDPNLYDPLTGTGSVAVEFVAPAVTSPPLEGPLAGTAGEAAARLPHVHWADLERRGYLLVEVARDRVQADWYHLADVTARDRRAAFVKGFVVRPGTHHLEPAAGPLAST